MMDSSLYGFVNLAPGIVSPAEDAAKLNDTLIGKQVPKTYCEEWRELFEKENYMENLKSLGMKGKLVDSKFRSVCWKVFLECLPEKHKRWVTETREMRNRYEAMQTKLSNNPRTDTKGTDLLLNNPLSQEEESPWNQYFQDTELRITIRQDVIRTFPEIEFFQTHDVQEMMVNILFCYARHYPTVSYRQGMHELLAPIIFVLHNDQQEFLNNLEDLNSQQSHNRDEIRELLNPDYTEHDAFFLFCQIMETVESWYIWNENYSTRMDQFCFAPFSKSTESSPHNVLGVKLCKINEQMLKRFDPELYSHLENMEIAPQIYGIRWLRLMFGREFYIKDLLIVWDAIFADSLSFNLVDYIFTAMLTCIRKLLLNSDYTTCLGYLMKYPGGKNVHYIIQLALYFKDPWKHQRPSDLSIEFQYNYHSVVPGIHCSPARTHNGASNSLSSTPVKTVTQSDKSRVRPNTLKLPLKNNRASSEPATLESDSESPESNNPEINKKKLYASVTNGTAGRTYNVWSFKGLRKSTISQSLGHLVNNDSTHSKGDTGPEREMVQLKSQNSHLYERRGSTPVISRHEAPNFDGVAALQSELSELKVVMHHCWRRMSLHLNQLQECMVTQHLEREDEMLLALASLKRVRDILKGTVGFTEITSDEEDYRSRQSDETTSGDWMLVSHSGMDTPTSWSHTSTFQESEDVMLQRQDSSGNASNVSTSERSLGSMHRQELKKKFLVALLSNQKEEAELSNEIR